MPLTPKDWSVVIVGRWNRAILTPSGIAQRLLGLEPETPIEVFIAIDALAPPQVKHDRMTVVAGWDRLIIQPEECCFPRLARAMEIGRAALQSLPETPLVAVGLNVKYSSDQPLEPLQAITRHVELDDRFSDRQFTIDERTISRSLDWNGGRIKIGVTEQRTGGLDIHFNFDRRSTQLAEHREWLSADIVVVEGLVRQILLECFQLGPGDVPNAAEGN